MALPLKTTDELPVLPVKNKGPSSFVKGGVGLLTTAVVDTIVAFSTSYWATWNNQETGEYGGYGLWKMWSCTKQIVSDGEITKSKEICTEKLFDFTMPFPGWYTTVQVSMTLALAGILSSLVMLFLYIFVPKCQKNKAALSALIGISYLSGLFIMVAVFVFGFKVAEELEERHVKEWFLSWSFSIAVTAFLLNQIAASVLITENKRLFQSKNKLSQESEYHIVNSDNDKTEEEKDEFDNDKKFSSVLIT